MGQLVIRDFGRFKFVWPYPTQNFVGSFFLNRLHHNFSVISSGLIKLVKLVPVAYNVTLYLQSRPVVN